jgi:uncharacterized protein (DUF1501 family)
MERRSFIKKTLLSSILPGFMGGLNIEAFGHIRPEALADDKIMVIIQLAGGNDGLNTVIPVNQYSKYKSARPTLAIPENKAFKLNNYLETALHPSLEKLGNMFNEGKATVIHDVGYPNPNFSHFRATDIWNTASDSNKYVNSGWSGRFLANQFPDYPNSYPNVQMPDPLAIQIGSIVNTSLQGPVNSMGLALADLNSFYNLIDNKTENTPNTLAGKELKFLRQVALQSNQYASVIQSAASKVKVQNTYPNTSLANQLKLVAQLIGGGLKTKFYYVTIGGFDTHSDQVNATDSTIGSHSNLLKNLSEAISAFHTDLTTLGVSKNVLGMTYSEFGRRIKENGSSGTDHGAAAPMFLFGDYVNPIVLGKPGILPSTAKVEDNLPMQYDFRSIYGSILSQWFCLKSGDVNTVMLKDFQQLPIVQGAACGSITANEPVFSNSVILKNYPNPFENFTTFEYKTEGGYSYIQLFNNIGQELERILEINHEEPGLYMHQFDGSKLKKGLYFARFQNNANQKVIKIVKT